MAVSDKDLVDGIGLDPMTGDVVLAIFDDLNWSNPRSHSNQLSSKVGFYAEVVRSRKLSSVYPQAAGRNVRIKIYMRYPPACSESKQLFEEAMSELAICDIPYSVIR